jgi:hypothetical protein
MIELLFYSRIPGAKRDEATAGWQKLHNEELRDLHSSPSVIRKIKSWGIRCAGHIARIWKKSNTHDITGIAGREDTTRKTKT